MCLITPVFVSLLEPGLNDIACVHFPAVSTCFEILLLEAADLHPTSCFVEIPFACIITELASSARSLFEGFAGSAICPTAADLPDGHPYHTSSMIRKHHLCFLQPGASHRWVLSSSRLSRRIPGPFHPSFQLISSSSSPTGCPRSNCI